MIVAGFPRFRTLLPVLGLILLAMGCGGEGKEKGKEDKGHEQAEAAKEGDDLTPFQLENGIGPVTEVVQVGPLDKALAAKGKTVFEAKCTMCHKMDTTYVGPSLGEVTGRRTPTYIMNMILNPQEMVERHPVAKKLLAERMTFMANQGLTIDEARSVVEYLRTQAKGTPKP